MTDTRIESPRSGETRTSKAAQSMASARTAGATQQPEQGFSSLLASLDSVAISDVVAGEEMAEVEDQQEKLTLTTLRQEDEVLLTAQGDAPWMSLVGQIASLDLQGIVDLSLVKQTARLDAQGDVNLRQSVATDFLSGRGTITQLAHRQALDPTAAQAHAAVLPDSQSKQAVSNDASASIAMNIDNAASSPVPEAKVQLADDVASSAAMVDSDKASPRAEQLLPQRPMLAASQGVSLQGMTAVAPQTAEHLKELLRATRAESQSRGAEKTGNAAEGHDLLTAAAAIGGAMGAAGAGMQGQGQSASDLNQSAAHSHAAPSEREQEVSEQVAFWVHQKTQHAALSIEHQGKPIQVQVQLNGQEAHVRFAAGDEQARQWLAQGQDQLRELLQAQGLNLSGVSVGAEGAGQGQSQSDAGGRPPANAAVARVGVQGPATGNAAAGLVRSQASGSVDLFV